jgi:hypothetical protein
MFIDFYGEKKKSVAIVMTVAHFKLSQAIDS